MKIDDRDRRVQDEDFLKMGIFVRLTIINCSSDFSFRNIRKHIPVSEIYGILNMLQVQHIKKL